MKYYLVEFDMPIPSNEDNSNVKGFKIISEKDMDLLNEYSEEEIDFELYENSSTDDPILVSATIGEDSHFGKLITIQEYLDVCSITSITEEEYKVFKKYSLDSFGTTFIDTLIDQCRSY